MQIRVRSVKGARFFLSAAFLCLATAGWCEDGKEAGGTEQVELFPIVKDGKWGYIDKTGRVKIEPKYDGAWDFREGLACVGEGLLRGYIDRTGAMVIEPQFAWAGPFSCGLAAAFGRFGKKKYGSGPNDFWGDDIQWYRVQGKYMYIDRKGNKKTPTTKIGGAPFAFTEGKSCSRKTCIGTDLQEITHDADELGPFSDGLAAARKGGKWGYLGHDMKWVIEPQFHFPGPFREGLAPVAMSNPPPPEDPRGYTSWGRKLSRGGRRTMLKWGYVDKSGEVAINHQFEDAWVFSEGLAPVRVDGKWGYVHTSGNVMIEAKYDYAWEFSEGLGRVLVGEKHGFVDKTGKLVIKPEYDAAWEFSKGLARVGIEKKEGYINPKGEYVWEPTE